MAWITPKLNWKSSDYANYDDFNRIENNILEVANYLKNDGYAIPDIIVRTNRDNTTIEYINSINRIEDNLETVMSNSITPDDWESKKTWTGTMTFNYKDMNRLENNIQRLLDTWVRISNNTQYVGTEYCGEEAVRY